MPNDWKNDAARISLCHAWSGERSQGLLVTCHVSFEVILSHTSPMTGLSLGRSQSIGGSMWLPPVFEGGWLEEEVWEGQKLWEIHRFVLCEPAHIIPDLRCKIPTNNCQTSHMENSKTKQLRIYKQKQNVFPRFVFRCFICFGYLCTTLCASFLRCVEKTRLPWYPWFTYVFTTPKVV